ncbi:MAG TPA: LuxR C-terminal-related transcriptional regulator [Pyrinomonadaceae bacterium]|nr:LuxR C-terminal-related transcriptional regulator [Pyrinomonadaceae bacterium]
MRPEEIRRMTESTSDPAFAVDGEGLIMAWNQAAANLFQLSASEALGRYCREILKGSDECGSVCSKACTVRQAMEARHPIRNFDLQVETANGRQWCNISVMVAENGSSINRFAVHIMRPIDLRKRLEILVRDFIVSNTNVPDDEAIALISSTRAAAREAELTNRELEILRLLSKGNSTAEVADTLHIGSTTVNNHVQHILRKLDAHNRLEAIRRAEHAGLI